MHHTVIHLTLILMSKVGAYRNRNTYRYKFMHLCGTLPVQCKSALRNILHVPKAKNGTIELTNDRYNENSAGHVVFSPGPEHGASRPTNEPLPKNI